MEINMEIQQEHGKQGDHGKSGRIWKTMESTENQEGHGKPEGMENREGMENQDEHGKQERMENQERHGKNVEIRENLESHGEHGKPRKTWKNMEKYGKTWKNMKNQGEYGFLLRLQAATFPHGKSQIPMEAGAGASPAARDTPKFFWEFSTPGKWKGWRGISSQPSKGSWGYPRWPRGLGKTEFWQQEAGSGGSGDDFRESGKVERDGETAGEVGVAAGTEQSWRSPGNLLEFSWSSPGFIQEISWSSPGALLEFQSSWSLPGALLEFQSSWSSPGRVWDLPGDGK